MHLRHLAIAGLALGVAMPASAQRAGTFDVGVFGRVVVPDDQLAQENAKGFGARLGLFLIDNVALEFEHSANFTAPEGMNEENRMRPYYLRLAIHHPAGIVLGLGWVRDQFDPFDAEPFADDGFHLLFGLEQPMKRGVGIRIDATYDYMPSPITETPSRDIQMSHWGVQAGLNFRLGRGGERAGVRDGDKDGVRDDLDQCLGTSTGDRVDSRGCAVPSNDEGRERVRADRGARRLTGS